MPAISVIVPTNRIGGLDVLLAGLRSQSNKDFELILVDGIKKYRPQILEQNAPKGGWGFGVKHVEPYGNQFPINAYCRAMNTGLAHADSPAVLTLCDYSWMDPDVVDEHIKIQSGLKNTCALLPYNYRKLPQLRRDCPTYSQTTHFIDDVQEHMKQSNECADRYVRDLDAGKLTSCMWSIFDKPLDNPTSLEATLVPPRTSAYYWCHLKNESYPIETLMQAGGFNEAMDGCHNWQDTELAERLNALGVTWMATVQGTCHVVNPRGVLYARRLERPIPENKKTWDASDKSKPVVPFGGDFGMPFDEVRKHVVQHGHFPSLQVAAAVDASRKQRQALPQPPKKPKPKRGVHRRR